MQTAGPLSCSKTAPEPLEAITSGMLRESHLMIISDGEKIKGSAVHPHERKTKRNIW